MKILSTLVGLIFIIPMSAIAAGIQVSPSKLEFGLTGRETQTKEIIIANPTADVQLYEITADDLSKVIIIAPQSFTLESGGRRIAAITIDPKDLKNDQMISTNLSIVSRPLAGGESAMGTGVKLPVTITALETRQNPWPYVKITVITAILLTLGLAAILYRRRKIKQKPVVIP